MGGDDLSRVAGDGQRGLCRSCQRRLTADLDGRTEDATGATTNSTLGDPNGSGERVRIQDPDYWREVLMDRQMAWPGSGGGMLHTPLCDLLGIEIPIIQAGMGMGSSAELAVAVSNAGGLGSLGCFRRPPDDLERQLTVIRERTNRPFAVNHLVTELDETAFAMTLTARPPVISFALGDPGELVQRAHDAGSLVVHQVTTVLQASQAVERGVDVIIAQGSEAGGYAGTVGALALIPQVEGWPRRWCWVRSESTWGHGFWPRMRRRSARYGSRGLWKQPPRTPSRWRS